MSDTPPPTTDMNVFLFDQPMPPGGLTLEEEPVGVKADRILRFFRDFAAAEQGVASLYIDGQIIMLVKYGAHHQFPQPTPDVQA